MAGFELLAQVAEEREKLWAEEGEELLRERVPASMWQALPPPA